VSDRSEIMVITAHPDDAEFMCTGTLALLHERGWEIHIATMAPGDCGTVQYSREEISRIRTCKHSRKRTDGSRSGIGGF